MMSHGILALPVVLANQRSISCHVTSIVQGCETSNVVLPFMGNTKSFMQLFDIHRPTPCITLLGLESDNKNSALKVCGYPEWVLKRVKKQLSHKQEQKRATTMTNVAKKKHESTMKKPLVVLPYIQSTTEAIQWVLKQHNIITAVRPNTTLRKLLVSPKDKVPRDKQCGVVYGVPCHNCSKTYVGETGRQLGTRIEEHRKEVEELSNAAYT